MCLSHVTYHTLINLIVVQWNTVLYASGYWLLLMLILFCLMLKVLQIEIIPYISLFLLRTGDRFTNCTQLMMRDYKFYLALENSFCADYVSEKFWRTMSLTLVPIVMGRYVMQKDGTTLVK